MGKPAARIGDSTAHGGAIVAGAPTVLIGGQPAARQGDMHACPLVNPGLPPPPHVGGPATLGSPTVFICGQMALRMGDMVQCSGPPDSVIAGCPTVLIGEGAGGGGGAGMSGAAASASIAGNDPDSDEDHFLHVKFVDKAGNPVTGVNYAMKTPDGKEIKSTLGKQILKTGIKEGNYEIQLIGISTAKWSKTSARVGDKMKLKAESFGIDSGVPASISVFMKDSRSSDKLISLIKTAVDKDAIEAEWVFEYDEDSGSPDLGRGESVKPSHPKFYFNVSAGGCSQRSDILQMTDDLDIELYDENGKAIPGQEYVVYLSNGEIRKGKLDKDGKATIKDIPPGKSRVSYPNLPDAKKLPD